MPTVNEEIRDRFLAHQIGIRRLSTAEVQKILAILERGERVLRQELSRRLVALLTLPGGVATPAGALRLEALLDDLTAIRKDYISKLYQTLADDLQGIAAYEQGFTAGIVRQSVPAVVALDMALASDDLMRAIVRSRPFQGRLLRDHFRRLVAKNGVAAKAMRETIEEGLLTGRPLLGIVRKVQASALGLERRAVTGIVHTAMHHVTGHMRDEVARLNDDILEAVQWVATLDLKTTLACTVRDLHIYDAVTHEPLDGGPPWLGGPGRLHWNCRSDSSYVMKSWQDLGVNANELTGQQRASMNGHVPAETDRETWLRGRPAADVDRVFGPTRARMWRDGVISADDLLAADGLTPVSLSELWADHTAELLSAGFEPVGFPGASALREALDL